MSQPTSRATMVMVIAALLLLLTFGVRQSTGLFLLPMVSATGMSIAAVSFAMAIAQFTWGLSQPLLGAMSDRYGPTMVLVIGGLVMALGCALTPLADSQTTLIFTLGILTPFGAGAAGLSVLLSASAQRLPPERRSFASGIINAGGSLGQFVFAPLMQFIIASASWVAAMLTMAVAALMTIPLALLLGGRAPGAPATGEQSQFSLRQQFALALRDRSYWCLHAGFFTCGFHVAFLVTHLPSELQLCGLTASVAANSLALIGLFNVVGSLGIGWLGQRHRMKLLLTAIYGTRALLIVVYLLMPKTALNVYLFAAALGVTWLATVPPTAGLVGKLFGTRYLATLFGLTIFSHQIGGFLGAWLGGLARETTGNYDWMWYADITLALLAAVSNLPIKEARVTIATAAA
ncbi:MAG: MFS transporter [Steroidobacteraceae bacterium]